MINIFTKLQELNFPKGEYVVVGGTMEAHGIRKANDLDILATPNLYTKLYKQGWKQCQCQQCLETSRLMLQKDDVTILPSLMFGNYIGDTRKLIKDADTIKGYPFLQLSEFVKLKKELARPKDFKDIELMEQYMQKMKK